ncbi:hypothetical protein C7446_2519 [Kushneria sinocarnis]|uniref:Uncharacterized protein n=1 Tax=Kushneria sinocarnis TaxID=595502 RepID=A0A420WUJ7_9GAMM|nr:hypothetical protein [Kushneria sinocarnis]RKQ97100.1 hypothetical protein C7446_2519 [Kushneria sinocarnis]
MIHEPISLAAYVLAKASGGNPVVSTVTVGIFYLMFSILEAGVEKMAFGKRFEHWLDPVFALAFMSFAAYAVWKCAIINVQA